MDRPNLLLIVLDAARADRFSCYGCPQPTTPHLDRIAAEGVRFDAAYSDSSWTIPAAFTLMTGLAPREHRAEAHRSLPEGMPTLPEALKQADYETLCASANRYVGPETGLDRGFDWFFEPAPAPFLRPLFESLPKRLGWTDKGGHACTSALLARVREARRPWFAVAWYFETHFPYYARRPFTARFCEKRPPLTTGFRLRRVFDYGATASDEQKATIRGLYDGCLAYEDLLVGRLRAGLEALGVWDDTVTLVTADHGEMLGEHRLMGHGPATDLYEPLIRVPLIVRAPQALPTPGVSRAHVQLGDVPRTLTALAGVSAALAPTAAETVDLREAARGQGRRRAIVERFELDPVSAARVRRVHPHHELEPYLCDMTAVIEEDWKLVHRTNEHHGLVNLAEDPAEERNVIDEHPQRAAEMMQAVFDWTRIAQPHPSVEDLLSDPASAVKRRLQDLGYLG